ncbi:MAG: hypothetical protein IPK16_05460 [Anaerolineales bacterium]|nr:hypothetical protein [Anaerolineales bacterium]
MTTETQLPLETEPKVPAPQREQKRFAWSRGDLGMIAFAIGLALIIWFIAINQENPLVVQDLTDRVPVTVIGLEQGLTVIEDLSNESVKLKLRAPRSAWDNLDVTDFRATIDLTNLDPGQHDVEVQVKSLDPQISILDVQRPRLRVTIDTVALAEAPVQVEVMDSSAFGYDWQTPVYNPMTVTVSGPATQVQRVAKVRAEVFLRNAKSQVERQQAVTPYDAQNRPVEGLTVEPSIVQVVVPVEQWPGRKEVAVRVKLSGRPADGYRLSSVKVEPSTVVLQGNADDLSEVPGFVETEPLSLEGATSDVRQRLRLILPTGVSSYDGDTVIGSAGIAAIEGGATVSQPLVQQGLMPGLVADSALQDVDVILSGPVPLLDSLKPGDLFAILDLTGLISGTHAVAPKIVLPDGIEMEGVIPETVEVVIKNVEGAATPPENALPALPTLQAAPPPTSTLPLPLETTQPSATTTPVATTEP